MTLWRPVFSNRLAPFALAMVVATGCTEGLDGPVPLVEDPLPGADLPVSPGLMCADQLTTVLTVTGADFSPLPTTSRTRQRPRCRRSPSSRSPRFRASRCPRPSRSPSMASLTA